MKNISIVVMAMALLSVQAGYSMKTRSVSRYLDCVTINKNYVGVRGKKGVLAKLVVSKPYSHCNLYEVLSYNLVKFNDNKWHEWTDVETTIEDELGQTSFSEQRKFVSEDKKRVLLLAIKKAAKSGL